MSSENKITLKPLKFEEAIAYILKVKPPKKRKARQKAGWKEKV